MVGTSRPPAGKNLELSQIPEYLPKKPETFLGSDEDVDVSKWSTRDVGRWLNSLELDQFAQIFAEHRITGDILHLLHEDHFKELGVNLVGERAILLRETARMYRGQVQKRRFRTIWEADGLLYTKGCIDWFCKVLVCVPCCEDPDHYKLTGSTLYVTELDKKRYRGRLCGTSKYNRAIDLSSIAGVSDFHQNHCCDMGCSADIINIDLDKEKGLDDVPPLQVKKGTGSGITAKILAAVEEAQSHAPGKQNMLRM
mmetsp:Transcript_18671/g.24243  ORF Transcript_18671/g.24243 Transcript_18671/m.24243 type:complete len:254 (-) Transcript_18671:304-1065(-)